MTQNRYRYRCLLIYIHTEKKVKKERTGNNRKYLFCVKHVHPDARRYRCIEKI